MRVKASYKIPKGKTEKQKKINKERKRKGPKLNTNYKDTSPYNVAGVDIKLKLFLYGIIDSCNLTSITVNDDYIQLKNSWTEAVMMMLDTLIENYPSNYMDKFIEFEITGKDLSINSSYGVCNFDGLEYKVYKLYDRKLYVESTFSYKTIFRALVGLTKALDINLDEIKFHVISKNYKESKLNYSSITTSEKIVNINELFEALNHKGNYLVSMKLLDSVLEVRRIEAALVAFCNILYDNLEDDIILLGGNESTGICLEDDKRDRQRISIRDSNLCVYSDEDTLGIIQFMQTSLSALKQDSNSLKFKFEVIDVTAHKHEWEIE